MQAVRPSQAQQAQQGDVPAQQKLAPAQSAQTLQPCCQELVCTATSPLADWAEIACLALGAEDWPKAPGPTNRPQAAQLAHHPRSPQQQPYAPRQLAVAVLQAERAQHDPVKG